MKFLDKLFGTTKIKVQFIDNANGETIGVADMSPDQLPETFSVQTTMHIRENNWIVEEAIPEHAADFIKTKELVLKMRLMEYMDPQNILFTLPSISNELPATTDKAVFNDFETSLREDDWRQNEFFKPSAASLIDVEIAAIKEIWTNNSKELEEQPFTAFDKCHVRDKIGPQSLSIDLEQLKSLLQTTETGSLKINDHFVRNGFSIRTAESTYYGTVCNNEVDQLCISDFTDRTIAEIERINKAFDLCFINWYHCDIIGADKD